MLTPFRSPRESPEEEKSPSIGSAVHARAYARHHLWNASIFWSLLALAAIFVLGALAAGPPRGLEAFSYFLTGAFGIVVVASFWRGSRALGDLLAEPISFEGRVSDKNASLFWNRLTFMEEKYYIRIERGLGMRPLAHGTGRDVAEGWFLLGQGFHDLLAPGDHIRGTLYPRSRLISTLVKV